MAIYRTIALIKYSTIPILPVFSTPGRHRISDNFYCIPIWTYYTDKNCQLYLLLVVWLCSWDQYAYQSPISSRIIRTAFAINHIKLFISLQIYLWQASQWHLQKWNFFLLSVAWRVPESCLFVGWWYCIICIDFTMIMGDNYFQTYFTNHFLIGAYCEKAFI